MEFERYFPVWSKLTAAQQERIRNSIVHQQAKKGTILHNGSLDCTGVFLIETGQLRAYILSDEGREITLYRLFDGDICLFSAACMMRSIVFDMIIETQKDTSIWMIPVHVYKSIMEESAPLAIYTNELMASRFSDVMWLVEQVMWRSLDKRLAAFLLEETVIEQTKQLKITHENIANHLGSHREVITRMLKYFQLEGMVNLSRGTVEIIDEKKLNALQNA
jgi:CRP/FNR family transcriptional regulator